MREENWTILKIVLTALALRLGVLPLTKSKRKEFVEKAACARDSQP